MHIRLLGGLWPTYEMHRPLRYDFTYYEVNHDACLVPGRFGTHQYDKASRSRALDSWITAYAEFARMTGSDLITQYKLELAVIALIH